MILLLSVLILVHEAGHFFAARMFGIRVTKFGFGLPIGPTLWEKQCGDTKILVHAFLLGGYVSFPDEDKDCDLNLVVNEGKESNVEYTMSNSLGFGGHNGTLIFKKWR